MRKLLSIVLTLTTFIMFCLPVDAIAEEAPKFKGMNDPALLPYIEDQVYQNAISVLAEQGYIVENVEAIYISQEYIDELEFNSQANIFFGYTMEELDAQFEGTKYVFTLGDDYETTVVPFQAYNDEIYKQMIKNVAIGAGVILIKVTVVSAVIATAAAAPALEVVLVVGGLSIAQAIGQAAKGFVTKGVLKYALTGNLEKAAIAGLENASEDFMVSGMIGDLSGVATKGLRVYRWVEENGWPWDYIAKIQKESQYSLDFIQAIDTMKEYDVYENAGLIERHIGNQRVLLPKDFDLDMIDPSTGYTNRQLLSAGNNPVDPNGVPYEWHQVGQKKSAPLALLTHEQHRDNYLVLHPDGTDAEGYAGQSSEMWETSIKKINKLLAGE